MFRGTRITKSQGNNKNDIEAKEEEDQVKVQSNTKSDNVSNIKRDSKASKASATTGIMSNTKTSKGTSIFSPSRYVKNVKNLNMRKKRPSSSPLAEEEEEELVISHPKGMTHRTHMARDSRATWGIRGLPDEWRKILEGSNLTKEKILKDEKKAMIAIKFVAEGQKNDRSPWLSQQEMQKKMDQTAKIVHMNPETKYEKLAKIGEGAGGIVYKIRIKNGNDKGKVLAVKISPIEELKYIRSEIAYHALSGHKNIVNYHETFQHKKDVWIVMDFVDGGCLTDILGEDNPEEWTERFIAYTMRECLQGLAFMHSQHLLHRDIKSDNVLVGRDGSVKLADFGFAVGLTKDQTQRKSTVGTPFWMAPEVIEGIEYDERCDVWSLGITAIELVNHEPPHMDKSAVEALLDILTSPSPKPNNVEACSELFLDFLDLALKKEPSERAFADDLLKHKFLLKASTEEQYAGWVSYILDEKAKVGDSEDSI